MSNALNTPQLEVPDSLSQQLRAFRSRVWATKSLQTILLCGVAVLVAFLSVYLCDRFFDTPWQARLAIFLLVFSVFYLVPQTIYRWFWKHRTLEQLARLLRVREPAVGDQLLSVIELAHNDQEQSRSRSLCAAAISQVAEAAKARNFNQAAPRTYLSMLGVVLLASGLTSAALAIAFPAAASSAWSRFATPWFNTPRYTFTTLEPIATNRVVPHGEVAPLEIRLAESTRWRPESATLKIGAQPTIAVSLDESTYHFDLPPQIETVSATIRVGDFVQELQIEPKIRPELSSSIATVQLPQYLQHDEELVIDTRGGSLTAVQGSRALIRATASRNLASAAVNGQPTAVQAAAFSTETIAMDKDASELEFWWKDHDQLEPRTPFRLSVKPTPDEPPSIVAQDLPRQAVVLDSEQLNFQALAVDDFGIKRMGIVWRGLDNRLASQALADEKILASGGPSERSLQLPAVFSATGLGITPQPLEVRLWVEDYLPDRPRVLGPPHILYVLSAEEHAIWIMNQMSKWHREAMDVRDKELQLYADNKRLRSSSPEELEDEKLRQELRRESAAEAANGRRLSNLSSVGATLLQTAARNPEIGVGHLDKWAEMLKILNDIGQKRMPSVSDLLKESSEEKQLARGEPAQSNESSPGQSKTQPQAPKAGKSLAQGNATAKPSTANLDEAAKKAIPKISDGESSLQPNENSDIDDTAESKPKKDGSKQGLPTTTLAGPPKAADKQKTEEPTSDEPADELGSLNKAIDEQADLLAEFEKVVDELNMVLSNLEGSTLVKRLKAASRLQNDVAEKIGSRIDSVFGLSSNISLEDKNSLKQIAKVEEEQRQTISYIMDDLQSFFDRRRMNQFKVVLDDMKQLDVLTAIDSLVEDIPKEQGVSMAQTEYWSDTLDRWGEDLVDPACSGQCPGSKDSDSLPPSLILEAMRILEGEMNLRESTRVAEQARTAIQASEQRDEALRLGGLQADLQNRTAHLIDSIEELPEGANRFAKDLKLLREVHQVMGEAVTILTPVADNMGDTGSNAIAAETEAIELLLKSKRINPKGGGGGGSDPGGGGTGTTSESALALVGAGLNQNERREAREVSQVTGETGQSLPEEFRAGLDEYFNRLERTQR